MAGTRLTKTVTGIYVFDGDDVIAQEAFDTDDADAVVDAITTEHDLEQEYADAERVVLETERIAALADTTVNQVRALQREVAQVVTRRDIRESGARDQLLVQAVRALEDIDERNNELSERLRPWYELHFPELVEEIESNEEFAAHIAGNAERTGFDVEAYGELAEDSTGMPIDEKDAAMLETFAEHLKNGYGVREELEQYIERVAPEVAPNLSTLVGPLLAARLLSLAGSLEQLAKMPASTIQVLGAEKAMFRHMRGEGKAPKHGVLFMHKYVQQVPNDKAGDMARYIANKAAIAARLDHFGGEFKGESLQEEVEEQFENLR